MFAKVDGCVYWYTFEALGNLFVETIGNVFHVNFLVYAHWFMSISISYIKDHYISVYQAIYVTYIVAKYLDTATVKTSTKLYNTTFPHDIILTKDGVSTSDDQVEKFTR